MEAVPDYSAYQDETPIIANILHQLSRLATQQKKVELEVAELEEQLRLAQARLRDLSEFKIPELMEQAEVAEYTTIDGIKISVKEKIMGSISATNADKAFAWLEEHGFENLIKREFKILFNKDEEAWANKFAGDLKKRKKPVNAQIKKSVNPMTLQSFVREQLEKGEDMPLDLFGVYRRRAAKIEFK